MKIILIGFMGSGKSTIGKAVSIFLSQPLIDMDNIVYQKTECTSMNEVFQKGGELLLRESEQMIAKEYKTAKEIVIATGGGVVMNKSTIEDLKEGEARTFFLHASFPFLMERLKEDSTRPLLRQAKSLYALRLPLYLQYADKVLFVENRSVDEITKEIVNG